MRKNSITTGVVSLVKTSLPFSLSSGGESTSIITGVSLLLLLVETLLSGSVVCKVFCLYLVVALEC
ncbi:14756_t:CDS:2 [Funneliformis mosseae]|uniref:14756_t:CDS:1 n=1 Tax=Funneliformis mosseae TaxID=27381 RepID=A0A9N9CWQ7_FUNMO|nr:14756_t:CDS:2 [Funneliformis mosseae]